MSQNNPKTFNSHYNMPKRSTSLLKPKNLEFENFFSCHQIALKIEVVEHRIGSMRGKIKPIGMAQSLFPT
jgi:hypothetical protein